MTKLSENFSLQEAITSQIAIKKGIVNQPNTAQLINLVRSAGYMQEIRAIKNVPIVPSSWFRSSLLNDAVDGAENSWHPQGLAVDFVIPGLTVKEAIDLILELDLPFMEIINEYDLWIHIAFAPIGVTPTKKIKVKK